MAIYEHHVVAFGPGRLPAIAAAVKMSGAARVQTAGGRLFGAWKPLIGLAFNHLVVVTEWPDDQTLRKNAHSAITDLEGIAVAEHDVWVPTIRPAPGVVARSDPGFVTHRWYDIRESDFDRFLELSSATWKNWEGVHDGAVLGLWREQMPRSPGMIRMRLMAWYRDMSVWERSRHWKGTSGAETANENLTARYDLTRDSAVSILQPL